MRKRGLTGLLTLLFIFGVFAGAAWAMEYSYLKASVLTVGQKTALVNDREITLIAAPYVKAGKTLVPLRFMENALGAEIGWDKVTRTASLKTGSQSCYRSENRQCKWPAGCPGGAGGNQKQLNLCAAAFYQ